MDTGHSDHPASSHLARPVVGHLPAPLRAHDLAKGSVLGREPEVVEGAPGAESEDGAVLRDEHAVGFGVWRGQVVRPLRQPRQGLQVGIAFW